MTLCITSLFSLTQTWVNQLPVRVCVYAWLCHVPCHSGIYGWYDPVAWTIECVSTYWRNLSSESHNMFFLPLTSVISMRWHWRRWVRWMVSEIQLASCVPLQILQKLNVGNGNCGELWKRSFDNRVMFHLQWTSWILEFRLQALFLNVKQKEVCKYGS